jgi:NAD dependent epimerase/dehydratase family enzyme
MTEEQKTTSDTPAEKPTPGSEILEELHSLGTQLTAAVKSLWESEDSRKLRQEIGDGFVELGHQVDTAIKSAQESEAAKQFTEQVKETMVRARESDITGKVEEGLVTGLRQLNDELSKIVGSLEARETSDEEPEGEVEA